MSLHQTVDTHPKTADPDIIVVGAGVVGLCMAIALARAGYSVACLGPASAPRNGRTVALLDGSIRLLKALGVWDRIEPMAEPLAVMRIVDDTGSLFRVPPVDFVAAEIGLPAFGANIPNADLVEALAEAAACTPKLVRSAVLVTDRVVRRGTVLVTTQDAAIFSARLVVAADGAGSPTRVAARIGVRQETYPQMALTAVLAHTEPHRNVSTEFHTRQGPFTLVPLRASAGVPFRSSLVWVMRPDEARRRLALTAARLETEIETQSRLLLGTVRLEGAPGHFSLHRMVADRLVGPRLALVGEAAHALPPIGAQGLNLSLRDAATLVDHLVTAKSEGHDPGSATVLGGYERARMGDVALRAGAVGALNRALLSTLLPVDALRGAGLMALSSLPALRRAVMRQGLMPRNDVPSLMG